MPTDPTLEYHRKNLKDSKPGSYGYEQSKKYLESKGEKVDSAPSAPDAAAQAEGLKEMPIPPPSTLPSSAQDSRTAMGYGLRNKVTADEAKRVAEKTNKTKDALSVQENMNVDLGEMSRWEKIKRDAGTGASDTVPVQIQKLESLPDSPDKQRLLASLRQKLEAGK